MNGPTLPTATTGDRPTIPWAFEWLNQINPASSTAPLHESAWAGFVVTGPTPLTPSGRTFHIPQRETQFLSSSRLEEHFVLALTDLMRLPVSFEVSSGALSGWTPDYAITSDQGTYLIEFKSRRRSVAEMVDELRNWTSLPMQELAGILGVSRRSVYSWREGTQPRPTTANRIETITAALRPLAGYYRPGVLRAWLQSGKPPRSELIRSGDLGAFEEAARTSRAAIEPGREIEAPGEFAGHGPDRVFELAGDVGLVRVSNRPEPRPEPLDWDF